MEKIKEATQSQLRLPQYRIDAVTGYLMERFDIRQPPYVTGQLLALIIELDKDKRLFPKRQDIAAAFTSGDETRRGCSIFSIDAALRVALSRNLIVEEMVVFPHPKRANAVIHRRRFTPSQELLDGVERYLAR